MKLSISQTLIAGFGPALAILAVNVVLPGQNALRQLAANALPWQQRLDVVDPLITENLIHASETPVSRRKQGVERVQLPLVRLALTSTGKNQGINYA